MSRRTKGVQWVRVVQGAHEGVLEVVRGQPFSRLQMHWKDPGRKGLPRVRGARRVEKEARGPKGVRNVMGMWKESRSTETNHWETQVGHSVSKGTGITQRVKDERRTVNGDSGYTLLQFQAARR